LYVRTAPEFLQMGLYGLDQMSSDEMYPTRYLCKNINFMY
jgi:hypothetical protein